MIKYANLSAGETEHWRSCSKITCQRCDDLLQTLHKYYGKPEPNVYIEGKTYYQ